MAPRNLSSLVLVLALTGATGEAHEFFSTRITWTREISRIVFKSCVGCHHEGGKAFSLTTFDDARPWAKAIKEEVLTRRMPPWGAVKGFGHFAGDRGLSQDEIGLIADWVEGGAPEGDRNYLPKLNLSAAMRNAGLAPASGPRARLAERPLPAAAPSAAIPQQVRIAGIAPRGAVKPGTQVVAELPDGSSQPLIWILEPKAAVTREFLFQEPVLLPAGSKVHVSQPGGQWKLLVAGATAVPAAPPTGRK